MDFVEHKLEVCFQNQHEKKIKKEPVFELACTLMFLWERCSLILSCCAYITPIM